MRAEDVIRIARVPRALAGAARLRQGLERWLADCDPARHGLPGDAIVLVRRLSTRWSVVLAPDPSRRYAPLAALLAGAHHAAVARADADVVWFADEAELLACIARDELSGALRDRWWWRVLKLWPSHQASVSPALQRWLQAPRQIPRAVQRLGEAHALAWLAALDKADHATMLKALAGAYALAPEAGAWVLERQLPMRACGTAPDAIPSDLLEEPAAAGMQATNAPGPRAARLHRLVLALCRDARAAVDLPALQALAASEAPAALPQASGPANHHRPRHAITAAANSAAPEPDRMASAEALVHPLPAAAAASDAVPRPLQAALHTAHARSSAKLPAIEQRLDVVRPAAPAASAQMAACTDVQPLAAAPARTLLHTRYGGLLFLLNSALRLSLYGDFTVPQHRGLDCSPWRFLMLAGRAWCGPGLRRDPAWAWLRCRAAGSRQAVPHAVWPELHGHLALALDDARPGATPRQRLRAMLGLSARLHDSGERLDVHFALAELPLAVRLSGLDRDPGWIPAAGCDVRFHFD